MIPPRCRLLLSSAGLALPLSFVAAQGRATPLVGEALDSAIIAYVTPYVETGNFSGAMLVAQRGRVLFQRAWGMANEERGVANEVGTAFQLASVSRVVTSIAAMRLAEQGKLDLDAPVSRYLPDWPRGNEITVHHLLTLSAGFPDINGLAEYGRWEQEGPPPAELVKEFRDLPLEFAPGSRTVHSNSNYVLLARILELVGGADFGTVLDNTVFAPTRMTATRHPTSADDHGRLPALGYDPEGHGGMAPSRTIDWRVKAGHGSLYSTVGDLYRLDRALLDTTFLSAAGYRRLFTAHYPSNGYGFFIRDRFGDRELDIGGRSPGFGAFWGRAEAADLTVIVLGNMYNGTPVTIGRDLLAIARGETPEAPALLKLPPPEAVASAAVGSYQMGPRFYRANAEVPIEERDGDLYNGDAWLIPTDISPRHFIHRIYWSVLEFTDLQAGQFQTLRYDAFTGKRR